MTPLDILYVEDDPDIRLIVRMALSLDPAVRLRTAASGAEALEMLEQEPVPDVALLDMMMPEMDGLTLLSLLRARPVTSTLPVIFMTAKVSPRNGGSYRDLGAIGVILKPFDPLRLPAQVRAALERDRTG